MSSLGISRLLGRKGRHTALHFPLTLGSGVSQAHRLAFPVYAGVFRHPGRGKDQIGARKGHLQSHLGSDSFLTLSYVLFLSLFPLV